MPEECHACCHDGEAVCTETFVCTSCLKARDVCAYLPGGLRALTDEVLAEGAECAMCAEKRTMDAAWVDKWHKKKGRVTE